MVCLIAMRPDRAKWMWHWMLPNCKGFVVSSGFADTASKLCLAAFLLRSVGSQEASFWLFVCDAFRGSSKSVLLHLQPVVDRLRRP